MERIAIRFLLHTTKPMKVPAKAGVGKNYRVKITDKSGINWQLERKSSIDQVLQDV
jgi:hypothetical protein